LAHAFIAGSESPPSHPQETDMSLNSFITLGRSGLRVSPFCLGTMTFGEDLGWGASVRDSETMIATYLERGGNFIDTANVYTNGHSEKIIGDFSARRGVETGAQFPGRHQQSCGAHVCLPGHHD
jgi:hypothetical protein